MAPEPLTPKQAAILRTIQDLSDANGGVAPTLSAIQGRLGLKSRSRVHAVVGLLVERGWVQHFPYRRNGISLLHRLPPTPPQALGQLVTVLRHTAPNDDGTITVTFPAEMVGALLAEASL